ncbi:MBL fold metallo-hydrolase [Candidatus Bathyarchaeota archaeon]|nr:MBL fold metallo-hydrolase [Candidatus Bathyarchaeota archaeon]
MEIVDGVHLVEGGYANVYLIIDEEGLTLVDTGMPWNAKRILRYLQRIGRKPSDISWILLTHHHIDHVGCAGELREKTGGKIAIHKDDAGFVEGRETPPAPKGAASLIFRILSPVLRARPFRPDLMLEEGGEVGGLRVIHTPGHTPGSISLYEPARKVILVGDALRFIGGRVMGPPESFTQDVEGALRSIEKISNLEFDVMLSGHGDPLRPKASEKIREFHTSLREKRLTRK